MRDIYVVVPRGTTVLGAADDWDRADMMLAGKSLFEVVPVELFEDGD